MARKFGPRQLKREPSPGFWPIHRKEYTWAPRTRPGPHAREKSLPLVVIVRESLGLANIAKEAIRIINAGKVKVDGVVRRDRRFQVGALGLVIDGRNQGYYGKITSITPGTYARRKIVRIETGAEGFETPAEYVIPVGTESPLVTLEK